MNEHVRNNIRRKMKDNTMDFLGVNDKFKFGCKACGHCCKTDIDISVNAFDIYTLSKYLKIEPSEFVNRFVEFHQGSTSLLPVALIKFKERHDVIDGSYKVCPFLKWRDSGYKCSVHVAKPFVCRSFPLGRLIHGCLDTMTNNGIQYFLQDDVRCYNEDKEHLVKDWLGGDAYDLESSEKTFMESQILILEILKTINLKKFYTDRGVTDDTKNKLYSVFCNLLYISYNTNDPIVDQFKSNKELIIEAINMFVTIGNQCGLDFGPIKKGDKA